MIQLAAVAGVLAVVGALVATSARDARLVVAGVALAMVASPLAATPQPGALTVAFRVVGAALAGYLLWVAARSRSISSEGSGAGLTAGLAIAAAAFAVGWTIAPVKPLAGPLAAQAAGFTVTALAISPLAGRDVLRAGTALTLITIGVSLVLQAWAGPVSGLEQVMLTALMVATVGATSLLISPAAEPALETESASEPDGTAVVWAPGPETPPFEPSPEAVPVAALAPAATLGTPGAPPEGIQAPARGTRIVSPRALRQAAPRSTKEPIPEPDQTPVPAEPPAESTVRRLRPRLPRR